MCNDCYKESNCFEVDGNPCDEGCKIHLDTDCISYGQNNTKLFNIGITKGTSLSHILKLINDKLGLLLTADFSKYDMNGLNIENKIFSIKDFVFYITKKVKELENSNASLIELTESLDEDIESLTDLINEINIPGISNSDLDINNTDSIKDVLIKIINNLSTNNQELEFNDSDSISFSKTNNSILASVKLSEDAGNIIKINEDGLYASNISITTLLNLISTNPALSTKLNNLIKPHPLKYDIMSESTQIIKYINTLGDEVSVTAKANILLKLENVKTILTAPTTSLVITFKGIS